MSVSEWPVASVFHQSRKECREKLGQLNLVDSYENFQLYRATDGSHWRLGSKALGLTRFLIRLENVSDWIEFDSTDLEKAFLVKSRGVIEDKICRWEGCSMPKLGGMEICVDHAYENGVRE